MGNITSTPEEKVRARVSKYAKKAKRKQAIEERYEKGRKALAALPREKRDALTEEAKADFLSRWPSQANQTESQFFKRMIENALIARIVDGDGGSNSSEGQIRVS